MSTALRCMSAIRKSSWKRPTTLDDLEVTAVKGNDITVDGTTYARVRRMIMRPAWISLLAPVSLRATSIKVVLYGRSVGSC